ncbi:hypothetical protein DVH24_011938 [Malus domestica]|uniref:RRM domain-containing protein n=1 Tax=Malus domestica TaxID=3750 RepID=A0A498JFU0_MALDO|nr:hypothetical protein DVH24_011938 [Malus domestica]
MKAQPYPLHLLTIPVSFGDFSDCLFRCNLHENSNNEAGFRWQTRQSELDRLFSKYGRVERVDMKSGNRPGCLLLYTPFTGSNILHFLHSIIRHSPTSSHTVAISQELSWWGHFFCHAHHKSTTVLSGLMKSGHAFSFAFVYFEDEQDAEDAICGMTGAGYLGNGLRVNVVAIMMGLNHWQTRGRLKVCLLSSFIPSTPKFVILKGTLSLMGRIRRNFAFVQFDTQEEATEALQATHLRLILDRVVSVAYALRDNSERGDVERGDRYCDSPPRRGSYGRHGDSPYWRSPSPGCRRRPNPDYGCPRSPVYDRYNGPVYDRRRSPERGRNVSPEYGRYRSAFSSHVSASSIIPGLSLTISIQNSVSLSAPSPSRSPSLTIPSASSLLIPSIPRSAEFFFRLSDVISPRSGSARSRKPPHNSDTNVSTSSFSAMTGSKSWYSVGAVDFLEVLPLFSMSLHQYKMHHWCVEFIDINLQDAEATTLSQS